MYKIEIVTLVKKMKKIFILLTILLYSKLGLSQNTSEFGIYIMHIDVDVENASFFAQYYWWNKFKTPADTSRLKEMSKVEFVNGDISKFETNESVEIKDSTYINGKCTGRFPFQTNFKDYPFDSQQLIITTENVNLTKNSLELEQDFKAYLSNDDQIVALDTAFIASNFKIISTRFSKTEKTYKTTFGDPRYTDPLSYSRLNYIITIKREPLSFLLIVIM